MFKHYEGGRKKRYPSRELPVPAVDIIIYYNDECCWYTDITKQHHCSRLMCFRESIGKKVE